VNFDWLHWFGIVGWLILSFFLSGMEAGVMALSRLRIRQWLREGRPQARALQGYLDHPENFLWTILVGNTIANFSVVAFIVIDLHTAFSEQPWLFWSLFLVVGGVMYLLGELLPKTLFRRLPNRLCLRLVWLFRLVHFVLSPLVAMVERFAKLLLRLTGGTALTGRIFGNREELRAFMQESGAALQPAERTLINRVLDLQTRTVGQIATPLEQADTLTVATPVAEIITLCRDRQHTRLPVWNHAAADRRIAGVVSLRNLIYGPENPAKVTAGDYLRPALFLPESTRLEEALQRLQRSGEHLAIIVDAAGRERGLVTIGDILRVLFGEVAL
jgi:CBS domain containing-hemolysin-like protein